MIKIPRPIYDITGGKEIKRSHEVWDSFVNDICNFIEKETGFSRTTLNNYEFLNVRSRPIAISEIDKNPSSKERRESDDIITEFIFCQYPIAFMIDERTSNNYCVVSYQCMPEGHIKEIADSHKSLLENMINRRKP